MSLALDKSSQDLFINAVNKIKSSLKKGQVKVDSTKPIKKQKKQQQKEKAKRGVVYLGHIPHGFYEEQMKDFFSQFGKVLKVRLIRSKKTGNSRGHAFIKFLHPEVAKIVAETMNNYLMCNRLLKAEYIPPEKQNVHIFKGYDWNQNCYPKLKARKKTIQSKNKVKSDEEHKRFVKKQINKVEKIKTILKSKGIEFDFKFADIPNDIIIKNIKNETKSSKNYTNATHSDNKTNSTDENDIKTIFKVDDEIEIRVPGINKIKKLKSKGVVKKSKKNLSILANKKLNKSKKKEYMKLLSIKN